MQKIDIKTLIIALLVLINLYQLQRGFSTKTPVDISNVFLKDKIESLNRDVNTVYVKLKLLDEGRYSPQLAHGISDLLGTGTWGSEYIVASKKISNFDINIGLGWGRLAERYTFKNPMSQISKRFDSRFGNDESYFLERR